MFHFGSVALDTLTLTVAAIVKMSTPEREPVLGKAAHVEASS